MSERGLPSVAMGIDQARNDDTARCLYPFSIRRIDRGRNRGDTTVIDQDVTSREIPKRRVHRQDRSTRNQFSLRRQ
jgi:hypothetical protein